MKTLIIGAGPLGSLYTYLLDSTGHDVTLLARDEHYEFLRENGIVLINEFTGIKNIKHVQVVNTFREDDHYELVIIIMRKNQVKNILPTLGKRNRVSTFLFLGNNAFGFDEYLEYLPQRKVLFGFPVGAGSRKRHVVHYIDSEKPNGNRWPMVLGEIDGVMRPRTQDIRYMFQSSGIPVKIVDDIDGWLKYHVAFVNPIAGALSKLGDNYKLAEDKETIRTYIRAVKEGGRVLRTLGYKKSYNSKLELFYWIPEFILINILKGVFSSKFAEIAMTMHAKSASDEMLEIAGEFKSLAQQASADTPYIDELIRNICTDEEDLIPEKAY